MIGRHDPLEMPKQRLRQDMRRSALGRTNDEMVAHPIVPWGPLAVPPPTPVLVLGRDNSGPIVRDTVLDPSRGIPHHEAIMSFPARRIVLTTVTALAVVAAAAACASPTAPTAPAAMHSSLHSSSQVTPSDGVLVGSGN